MEKFTIGSFKDKIAKIPDNLRLKLKPIGLAFGLLVAMCVLKKDSASPGGSSNSSFDPNLEIKDGSGQGGLVRLAPYRVQGESNHVVRKVTKKPEITPPPPDKLERVLSMMNPVQKDSLLQCFAESVEHRNQRISNPSLNADGDDGYDKPTDLLRSLFGSTIYEAEAKFIANFGISMREFIELARNKFYVPKLDPDWNEYLATHEQSVIANIGRIEIQIDSISEYETQGVEQLPTGIKKIKISTTNMSEFEVTIIESRDSLVNQTVTSEEGVTETVGINIHPKKVYQGSIEIFDGIFATYPELEKLVHHKFSELEVRFNEAKRRAAEKMMYNEIIQRDKRTDFEKYHIPQPVWEYIQNLIQQKKDGTCTGDFYDELWRFMFEFYVIKITDECTEEVRYRGMKKTGFDLQELSKYLVRTVVNPYIK